MSKFVLAYFGGSVPKSEEDQKAVMDAWNAWFAKHGDKVLDPGNPFGTSQTVGAEASPSGLNGYSIIDAADLAAAVAVVEDGHPHIGSGNGARVEVYETFAM